MILSIGQKNWVSKNQFKKHLDLGFYLGLINLILEI